MSKHHGASGPTRAVEALETAGVSYTIVEYRHDPRSRSFGEESAERIGGDPGRIFKTLLVRCDGDEYVVAVVPVDHHLSMKAIARAVGGKSAEMADPAVAQRRTGYVVGGISPLGQTTRHRTFIDESALDHETILVSGGKRGMSVEVSPVDLAEVTGADIADLHALG
jgi:Cys-tRNA(Pro)/Cys-tRNA(Cys) deacylase